MCASKSSPPSAVRALARLGVAAGALTAATAAGVGYGWVEARSFALRRVEVPVLPPGAPSLRVLHLSDLHLTPDQHRKFDWVQRLSGLEPDLVVNTGDNLAHPDSVPLVLKAYGRLLEKPGVFVWGSNDYYAPGFKNPVKYLLKPKQPGPPVNPDLPWRDLRTGFEHSGWRDLTHRRTTLEIAGVTLAFRGTDDAHLNRDDYSTIAGPEESDADVTIGVTHAPYLRVLDGMATDGLDLIFAGHTHGGQLCIPGYGALVTNCDLDTDRVQGLSQHTAGGHTSWLHVSGGLGTSPYAPVRFACPPSATLLTLSSPAT